jgi:pimeloyl-ACP methyl ester carboxylesterase
MQQRIAFLVFVLALISALPCPTARAQDRKVDIALNAYAKPARLVKLPDGRTINLDCRGKGSPTVILFAGLTGWSQAWSKVQPQLATETRVCAFDAAGFGYSSPSPDPQDAAHITDDLENALKAAKISGPYILTGHSAGSFQVLHFADHRIKDVAGIVLVDPSIPAQPERFARVAPAITAADQALDVTRFSTLTTCASALRAGPMPADAANADNCFNFHAEFPEDLKVAIARAQSDPRIMITKISHIDSFDISARAAVNAQRSYAAKPLIVLTAGALAIPTDSPPAALAELPALRAEWKRAHDELAALSTQGVNRIVEGSGHRIEFDKPEAVIAAVEDVLAKVRK